MDHRDIPEYHIEILADSSCIRDVVRGIIHTIFFHRYFPSVKPSTIEVLDFTLPLVVNSELENLIDTRVGQLVRQIGLQPSANTGSRGVINVQFFEKRRRKTASGLGWFTGGKGNEEVCWESWFVEVALVDSGTENERLRDTKAITALLQNSVIKILSIVNRDKDHIPPITTSETNPFPYSIHIQPKIEL